MKSMRIAMPKRSIAVATLGGGMAITGLAMVGGWVFRKNAVVLAFPGYLMVFDTALGFAAAGIALAAGAWAPAARRAAEASVGWMLAALGALVLAQYVFGVSLGVDWPELHVWLPDLRGNRYPGRMSPATSATFVIAGAAFFMLSRARTTAKVLLVRGLTAAVAAVGALAIVGYLLNLSDVLEVYWLAQVSLPTAVGFVALGSALWLAGHEERWSALRLIKGEDDRIALAGAMVLAVSIGIAGVAVFWLMQASVERVLATDLAFALKSRQARVGSAIRRAIDETSDVADRPNVRHLYLAPSSDPRDPNNPAFLTTLADSLLKSGFSAFAFYDKEGRELARAGRFIEASELRMPVDYGARGAEILWDGNLALQARADVTDAGRRLGEVRGQHRLPEVDGMMTDDAGLGATGEFALCTRRESKLHCAPTRFQSRPFDLPATIGKPLPMDLALDGQVGVLKTTDYRGKRVFAAHSPLETFAIGAVLKTDLAELNAPIRERLVQFALTLLFASVAGGWLLRNRVRPLVRRVARSEEQLRMALESSKFALWDWDIAGGQVYLSEQWSALLGGTPQPTVTTYEALLGIVHPDDAANVREHVKSMLKGTASHYDVEHRVRVNDGEWKWIRSRGRAVERSRKGIALRAIGTNVDISERMHQQLQVTHKANHDALTELPNRSLFRDRLDRALLRSRRESAVMGLMYIDVDKFKGINDTLGHAAGDLLLKEFARRLLTCVRATDTVARLGGDEFAVILEGLAGRDDGLRIAGNIVEAMRREFALEGNIVSASCSVGIAFHDGVAAALADELLGAADSALYEAKANGRNGFRAAGSPGVEAKSLATK